MQSPFSCFKYPLEGSTVNVLQGFVHQSTQTGRFCFFYLSPDELSIYLLLLITVLMLPLVVPPSVFKKKREVKGYIMPVMVETTVPRMPRPVPIHFSHAEQYFSLRKRRVPLSSSSTSNSTCSSPARLSHSLPPQPPSKGCPPLSRIFPQQPSPWTPLSCSLAKSPPPNSVYDPSKQQSYFNQCFTSLGLLGRGSFGEVYKVSKKKTCVSCVWNNPI